MLVLHDAMKFNEPFVGLTSEPFVLISFITEYFMAHVERCLSINLGLGGHGCCKHGHFGVFRI